MIYRENRELLTGFKTQKLTSRKHTTVYFIGMRNKLAKINNMLNGISCKYKFIRKNNLRGILFILSIQLFESIRAKL